MCVQWRWWEGAEREREERESVCVCVTRSCRAHMSKKEEDTTTMTDLRAIGPEEGGPGYEVEGDVGDGPRVERGVGGVCPEEGVGEEEGEGACVGVGGICVFIYLDGGRGLLGGKGGGLCEWVIFVFVYLDGTK